MGLRDLSVVVLGLTAAVATTGCSSSDDGPSGPNYAHPSESAFCTALAEAQCSAEAVKSCYSSSDESLPDDTASCVDKRSAVSLCRASVTGGVDLGSPTYNPQVDTTACIDAHRGVYSDARLTMAELTTALETCIQVFSGPGGNGAECGNDYDCSTTDELRCVRKPGAASGTCAEPVEIGGGEDCSAAEATCAEDFFCDADSSACLKLKAADAACSATTPCLPDLLCAVAAGDEEGVCEAKIANNQDCTLAEASSCEGGFCNAPSGQTEGKCASTLVLAQTSESCGDF